MFRKQRKSEDAIIGYADSDHGGSIDFKKSMTGYMFTVFGDCN